MKKSWTIRIDERCHFLPAPSLFVTASIGIAFYPDDGNEVDALVNRADEVMYNAKQKGFDTSHPYLQSAYGESSE